MENNFKKNKFIIIKSAISKELAEFVCNYFLLKKEAVYYMYENNLISPNSVFGTWKDKQVPNMYSHYSDFAMETLLIKLLPVMEKETKLKLIPTYSYARIYEKKSNLFRHKDRESCEISTTLNLGGDSWPIFIDPTGEDNVFNKRNTDKGEECDIKKTANKGIKINLEPGDMLVYKGDELEHWREEFNGEKCVQVFLHYNEKNGKFKDKNLYDGRPMLGVPSR
jgi:hypothetical protein